MTSSEAVPSLVLHAGDAFAVVGLRAIANKLSESGRNDLARAVEDEIARWEMWRAQNPGEDNSCVEHLLPTDAEGEVDPEDPDEE